MSEDRGPYAEELDDLDRQIMAASTMPYELIARRDRVMELRQKALLEEQYGPRAALFYK